MVLTHGMAFLFEMETTAKSILQHKHIFFFALQQITHCWAYNQQTHTHARARRKPFFKDRRYGAIEYIRSLPSLSDHILFQIATVNSVYHNSNMRGNYLIQSHCQPHTGTYIYMVMWWHKNIQWEIFIPFQFTQYVFIPVSVCRERKRDKRRK